MDELIVTSQGARDISNKKYIVFVVSFLAFLGMVALAAYKTIIPYKYLTLSFYTAYMSMAFTFCPLPTIWIVLWAAREFNPWAVAFLGALATCVAYLNDYYIFNWLHKFSRVRKIRGTKLYKSTVKWFGKAPFITLTVASFLPIPVDLIRLLSISSQYKRRFYVLACFLGRFPRYAILAIVGHELKLSNKWLLIILAVTVMIPAVKTGIEKLKSRGGKNENEEIES